MGAANQHSDRYEGNVKAPPGKIWQCMACGRYSEYRYGFDETGAVCDDTGRYYAMQGWDESCMMNCALVPMPVGRDIRVCPLQPPIHGGVRDPTKN